MKKLNLFFTAGFIPNMDMVDLIKTVQEAGADMVEIGMPYSDPIVDGPVIQEANKVALNNGITISKIFQALENLKEEVSIPVVLMGYLNPVMQYGVEKFCADAQRVGIKGVIIPDLPAEYYEKEYKHLFEKYDLAFTFIVTPQTPNARIQYFDQMSHGFIYAVSDSTITGKEIDKEKRIHYFNRLKALDLKNDVLIGFGIRSKDDFQFVNNFADGAIIGTAFIQALNQNPEQYLAQATEFVKSIKV